MYPLKGDANIINKPNAKFTMVENQYPIILHSEIQPRDQIKLVPEEQLEPLVRVELNNLRAGIFYKFTIADTPENRQNFNFKALYFQMVAYKEGWEFKPEHLQVVYVSPNDSRLNPKGNQYRLLQFKEGTANKEVIMGEEGKEEGKLRHRVSPENRLGFEINKDLGVVTQIEPEEADNLASKVICLFR